MKTKEGSWFLIKFFKYIEIIIRFSLYLSFNYTCEAIVMFWKSIINIWCVMLNNTYPQWLIFIVFFNVFFLKWRWLHDIWVPMNICIIAVNRLTAPTVFYFINIIKHLYKYILQTKNSWSFTINNTYSVCKLMNKRINQSV